MSQEQPQSGQASGSSQKMFGVVVFVLAFALVGGGAIVLKSALKPPPTPGPMVGETIPGTSGSPGVAQPGDSLEKMLSAAQTYMGQRDYTKAEAVLTQTTERFPDDQSARIAFAQCLVAQKKFKEAYPQYQAAIALTPKSEKAAHGGVGDPKLHFEAGTVANQCGMVDRAEEHYSMAQAADPTEPRYPLYLAMVQIKLGKDAPAMASLVRTVKLNPDLAMAWGTMAELALKDNQLGLAMQHVEKARGLEPASARWRLTQAKIFKRRAGDGDVQSALTMLLAMDASDRLHPEVMKTIAECYGMLQKPGDAAAMYADAAKNKPDDAEIAYQAALWFRRAGNEAESTRFGKVAHDLALKQGKQLTEETTDR